MSLAGDQFLDVVGVTRSVDVRVPTKETASDRNVFE